MERYGIDEFGQKVLISVDDDIKTYSVPDDVIVIGEKAFFLCENLEAVYLSDSVKTIESRAFYGCKSLKTVRLSKKLRSIGNYAFGGCYSLKELYFYDSLEKIGYLAFENSGLEYFTLPISISHKPGSESFNRVPNLKLINLYEIGKSIQNDFGFTPDDFDDGVTPYISMPTKISQHSKFTVNGIYVENCIYDIGSTRCFYDTAITIPTAVNVIPEGVEALGECCISSKSDATIQLPSSIQYIDNDAFSLAIDNLKTIYIPKKDEVRLRGLLNKVLGQETDVSIIAL